MMSTPEVAFLTRHGPFSAGVAITASHNPARDNGIKIFAKSGHKLPDAVERKLEAEVARGVAGQAAPPRGGRFGWMQLGRERHYEEFLLKTFRASFANLVSRPLRVVFDCAFGARSIDLQTISSLAKSVQLGRSAPELRVGSPMSTSAENSGNALDVVFLNAASPNRPEEHHLINAETGSQHPKSCARAVKELQADLGVCFDGDGDRCILIDETGQVRDGDDLLGVLAADLHEQGRLENSVVVGTTMANMGLEVFLRGLGLKFVRADVGDRFVAEAMRREGAKLGGEASGHLIIADEGYDIGDGLYTALRIVEIMLDKQKPLSALCAGIRRHPQVLVNVPVREKPPLENLKSVSEAIRNANRRLRDSRVLVRYSGTEPVLRVMVESTTAELAQQTADEIADAARREIGL
jgi:phosphoglucosamine mutase